MKTKVKIKQKNNQLTNNNNNTVFEIKQEPPTFLEYIPALILVLIQAKSLSLSKQYDSAFPPHSF